MTCSPLCLQLIHAKETDPQNAKSFVGKFLPGFACLLCLTLLVCVCVSPGGRSADEVKISYLELLKTQNDPPGDWPNLNSLRCACARARVCVCVCVFVCVRPCMHGLSMGVDIFHMVLVLHVSGTIVELLCCISQMRCYLLFLALETTFVLNQVTPPRILFSPSAMPSPLFQERLDVSH